MTRFTRTGAKVGARLSGASECINAPIRAPVSAASRLELSSGTLEALTWLALLLVTAGNDPLLSFSRCLRTQTTQRLLSVTARL